MNDERDFHNWIVGKPVTKLPKDQAVETAYRAGHSTGANRLADAVRLLRRVHWLYVDTGDMRFKADVAEFIQTVDPDNLCAPQPKGEK